MKINILCPGPSLPKYTAEAVRADLRIGVNRAATLMGVDVWCCADHPCYSQWQHEVISCPTWFTDPISADYIAHHGTAWRGNVVRFDAIDPGLSGIDWRFFSFTAAIGYAVVRGARHIYCYGCDWSGQLDWDGVAAGNSRSVDRWTEELRLFNRIRDAVMQRGLTLERIL